MAFLLQASCPQCSYQSDRLWVGNGKNFICICEKCKSVVNPAVIRFQYTMPDCPNCHNRLSRTGGVDSLELIVSYEEPVKSSYQCPRCSGPLYFKTIAHALILPDPDSLAPKIGSVVHGRVTESGELEIPGLYLSPDDDEARIESTVPHAPGSIMELRVSRIDRKTSSGGIVSPDHVETLDETGAPLTNVFILEFLRYLSAADLD